MSELPESILKMIDDAFDKAEAVALGTTEIPEDQEPIASADPDYVENVLTKAIPGYQTPEPELYTLPDGSQLTRPEMLELGSRAHETGSTEALVAWLTPVPTKEQMESALVEHQEQEKARQARIRKDLDLGPTREEFNAMRPDVAHAIMRQRQEKEDRLHEAPMRRPGSNR